MRRFTGPLPVEQRGTHTTGQRRPTLQVTECRTLDGGRFGPERRERVRDPATRQICGGVEPAAIPIRAPHPQPGAARDDDLRVERANVLDGEPGPLECAGQPIGQEDIRTGQQPAEQLAAHFGFDVDRDAALTAVAQLEDEVGIRAGGFAGETADDQRAPGITRGDAFHLDHVGAPVRQGGTGRRYVGPRRQLDDPDTAEHACPHSRQPPRSCDHFLLF